MKASAVDQRSLARLGLGASSLASAALAAVPAGARAATFEHQGMTFSVGLTTLNGAAYEVHQVLPGGASQRLLIIAREFPPAGWPKQQAKPAALFK